MKRLLPALALAAAVVFGGRADAATAASSNLTINTSVNAVCSFSAPSYVLSLSNYDATAASLTGLQPVKYQCTKGTAPTFSFGAGLNDSSGQHRLKSTTLGTPEFLNYNVSFAPVTLPAATGGQQNVDITVTVPGAQYVSADAYGDTIVLDVNL